MQVRTMLVVALFALISQIADSQLIGCRNNPCQNGGKCIDQGGSFYGYSCQCIGPWKGVNCDQSEKQSRDTQDLKVEKEKKDLSSGSLGIGGYAVGHNQWSNQYNQYGQYGNQYGNQYGQQGQYGSQYGSQYPYNNNQYGSQYGNQYGSQYGGQYGSQINPLNPGLSGSYGSYGSYGGAGTACQSNPCYNGAYCQPSGQYSYTCLCRTGFYGMRCESYTNQNTITIGIIIGSIALFCVIVVAIAIIAYCCCCGRRN